MTETKEPKSGNSAAKAANKTAGTRPTLNVLANMTLAELYRKERRLMQREMEGNPALMQLLAEFEAEQAAAAQRQLVHEPQPPAHYQAVKQNPEAQLLLDLSKDLWTSNPGYIYRHTTQYSPTTADHFHLDEQEKQWLQEHGEYQRRTSRASSSSVGRKQLLQRPVHT